ncbi:MAG TPA: siphovirus ReqiPepy6 Gp37-like family protein [Candidatus Mediterraneibacter merdigallinarum]|nr:siphovirus ReqiPepy6 Gp37-like family protein [Candidatus Mediterraneibacter merdigallinarum]
MVILANEDLRELGSIKDANITVDLNGNRTFSVQIARSNWYEELTFSSLIYIMGTEYGGIIGEVLTDTTLDYVELKGLSWRGRLAKKIIQPPAGSDYKTVSGELHTVMKSLIEPEFNGLFVVSQEDTGVTVSNYQFERYCTLLDGLTKMLKSKGYRLQLSFRREQNEPGYLYIEAVPIVDYSNQIELSRDCQLNYTMDDKRDGVNHLIVTGKGEMQDRNVLHLYVQENGTIGSQQYYTGLQEIAEVYENTSTETDELQSKSEERLQELMNKKTFKMDVAALGIDVNIGDIVGGRDYLTGMYMANPVENIVYELTGDIESKTYKLEGENQ